MPATRSHPEIARVLLLIDEAFDKKAWHGPNLLGALRRLSPEQAAWRSASGRHSIAEITLHCAYWKYAVRRRLRGDKRGSFPLKGSDWIPVPRRPDERLWREYLSTLRAQHGLLREAVAAVPASRLAQPAAGGKTSTLALVQGIALHDVYHAGQIQLIKVLHR